MHTTQVHDIWHHLPLAANPKDGGKSSGNTAHMPPHPQATGATASTGNIYADEIPQVAGLP